MKFWRHFLLCALAVTLSGCGTTVNTSLKVEPASRMLVGQESTAVILPFADYTHANNIESAFRRNMFVNECIMDHFVRLGFHLPVQEDVFQFLTQQHIINVAAYNPEKTKSLEYEMDKEWSPAMKEILQGYIDIAQRADVGGEGDDAVTHGLTGQEIVKIGRHFSADYIVRGRIIQYKDRLDPAGARFWKTGVLPFFVGGAKKILVGQAMPESYDTLHSNDSDWQSLLALGDVPQAVVQLRIWVQDAYTGNVVWTNRANVQVSPQSEFADYQYDNLFETAVEAAVTSLMEDFAYTVYSAPRPEQAKQTQVIENPVTIDIVHNILFDFNKSVLKNEYKAKLQELGLFLEKNPKVRLVLAGYTDGVGSEGYNLVLSKKRAESVFDYLMAHSKIDKNRVSLEWYGKADPTASNQTEEGRALNRRVSVIQVNM